MQTVPFDKITIDVISVEYKVTCDDKKEWVKRSFEKLQRIREFFKNLGNYKEVAILPWGSGEGIRCHLQRDKMTTFR